MRSFYTFIIQKYFELIPQAQQMVSLSGVLLILLRIQVGVQVALQVFGIATISASTHTPGFAVGLVLQSIGRQSKIFVV